MSSHSWREVDSNCWTSGPDVLSLPVPNPQPQYSRQTWAINNAKYGVQKTQKKQTQRKWGPGRGTYKLMECATCRLCRSWIEDEKQKDISFPCPVDVSFFCPSRTPWDWQQLWGINNAQYGVRTRLLHCHKQRTENIQRNTNHFLDLNLVLKTW